jgi:hypothetical protein
MPRPWPLVLLITVKKPQQRRRNSGSICHIAFKLCASDKRTQKSHLLGEPLESAAAANCLISSAATQAKHTMHPVNTFRGVLLLRSVLRCRPAALLTSSELTKKYLFHSFIRRHRRRPHPLPKQQPAK